MELSSDSFFFSIPDLFSGAECGALLSRGLELPLNTGRVADTIKLGVRKSEVAFCDFLQAHAERIFNAIAAHIPAEKLDVASFEKTQFTRYRAGEFYRWHSDVGRKTPEKYRLCSMVILLNEDYSGGELELIDEEFKVTTFCKTPGTLHCFSSHLLHRVAEVKTGVRYSLVGWLRHGEF